MTPEDNQSIDGFFIVEAPDSVDAFDLIVAPDNEQDRRYATFIPERAAGYMAPQGKKLIYLEGLFYRHSDGVEYPVIHLVDDDFTT